MPEHTGEGEAFSLDGLELTIGELFHRQRRRIKDDPSYGNYSHYLTMLKGVRPYLNDSGMKILRESFSDLSKLYPMRPG